jgi:hypothetical protein
VCYGYQVDEAMMARLKDHILTVLRGELLAFLPQPHAWLRHAGVLLSLCRASFSSEITVVSSFVALPVRSAIRGGFGSGSGFEYVGGLLRWSWRWIWSRDCPQD